MEPIANNLIANSELNKKLIANSSNRNSRVDQIADYLVEKLNSKDSRRFYYKVASKLPQAEINNILEWCLNKARSNGSCAGCLFNVVARKKMGEL